MKTMMTAIGMLLVAAMTPAASANPFEIAIGGRLGGGGTDYCNGEIGEFDGCVCRTNAPGCRAGDRCDYWVAGRCLVGGFVVLRTVASDVETISARDAVASEEPVLEAVGEAVGPDGSEVPA